MNIDLNMSIINEKFILRHTRKAFGIGAFLCMSATAIAAFASSEKDYKSNAQMLIASNAHSLSYQQQDVQSLKEQLIEKTKELEEYKACLFRPSHPDDQAKIIHLSRQITELEKSKQELIALIKTSKEELADIKKQKDSLEVSSEALTDYIKTHRAIVEEERTNLLAKIKNYEEEITLERKNNEELVQEVASLRDSIFTLDKLLAYHESGEDLQDALLDASMLKFELDDARALTEQKEKEHVVSTLNYLTMAYDHINTLREKHQTLKEKIRQSELKQSVYLAAINELENENSNLHNERAKLKEKIESDNELFKHSTAQMHLFANKLLEGEEALNAALLFYESTLSDLAQQLETLKHRLAAEEAIKLEAIAENEFFAIYHHNEKEALKKSVKESNEILASTIIAYQLAIHNYLQELQQVEEKFAVEEGLRMSLESEIEDFLNHTKHSEEGMLALSESQNRLSRYADDLAASEAKVEENLLLIDDLNEQLATIEKEHFALKQEYEELLSKNSYSEQQLLQYEEGLFSAEMFLKEYVQNIQDLKEKIAIAENEHSSLQQDYDELLAKNESIEIQLLDHEQNFASAQDSIQEYLKQIESLEKILLDDESEHFALKQNYDELENINKAAERQIQDYEIQLTSSRKNIEEYEKHLEDLKEKLVTAESDHLSLKQAHEELALKNYLSEAMSLDYEEKLTASKAVIEENLVHIQKMEEKLAAAEEERQFLRQAYDNLVVDHAKKEHQLLENEELQKKLANAENNYAALKQTYDELLAEHSKNEQQFLEYVEKLTSSSTSISENAAQIEELQKKLAAAEEEHISLQQNYNQLLANYSQKENQLLENEKDSRHTQDDLSKKIQNAEEKILKHEESLALANTSIAEHLTKLENLHEKLTSAEQNYQSLKQTHDELVGIHSNQEKELREKDQGLAYSQACIAEHLSLIDSLQQKLAASEESHNFLKQKHEELSKRNANSEQQLSQYENDISASKACIADHLQNIMTLQEKLSAVETDQLFLKQAHDDIITKNTKNQQQLTQYEEDLAALRILISEHLKHIDALQTKLATAEFDQQVLRQAHENFTEEKSKELNHYQQQYSHITNQLKNQLQDQALMIEKLTNEIVELYAAHVDKDLKENELEQAVKTLTILAERQDHALAEANSTFSMVQAYNQQLELENLKLKERLHSFEIAERSERKSSQSNEKDIQQVIPPALFKLLKP